MQRRLFMSYLLASASSLAVLPVIKASEKPLVLGVFPRRNIKLTYQLFTPMVNYLSEQLDRKVILETSKSFKDFWFNVKHQKYDIVHFNQYHYIVSHQNYDYQVFAINKELGKTTIAGSIIVRRDSNINTISDLKGKTILFGGGRRAMQSYISATWLLRQAGLQADDYVEKFAINPPNTIISTYFKRADASGAGDVVMQLDNVRKRIDISQLKYLAKTKSLPHLPWAMKNSLAADIKLNIKDILTTMSKDTKGIQVLHSARLNDLMPAIDSDFDGHREIVMDVYGSDYGVSFLK